LAAFVVQPKRYAASYITANLLPGFGHNTAPCYSPQKWGLAICPQRLLYQQLTLEMARTEGFRVGIEKKEFGAEENEVHGRFMAQQKRSLAS